MSDHQELPLVSIVTPSFNQAEFLEETILSVLEQDYPNLEYIVVDGGSTDGSVEIIRKYADRLAWWVSEPDHGQADAINKGFAQSNGEIVAWLNSDDIYRPGAVRQAVEALQRIPHAALAYGQLESIDREGNLFNTIRYRQYTLQDILSFRIIGQPAVFMRREVQEIAGPLNTSYNYLLDHELWIRMYSLAPGVYVPQIWAAARHHSGAKNVAQAAAFGQEALRIADWVVDDPQVGVYTKRMGGSIRAGAERLNARYLLDGGQPGPALKAYLRTLWFRPAFALEHWHRMLYAFLSLLGLGWLRRPGHKDGKPILVTGLHRSGTTWVGRMLALSGQLAYVSEPLNVWHRPGVLSAPTRYWYTYICESNEAQYLPGLHQTLKLDYHLWAEIRSLRSLKDVGRMLRDWGIFTRGRLKGQRVLLKDPFAIFSAAWFAQRLGCQVAITVRHPAAFVSSLKRLDWSFDFKDLLAQPLLMRDCLEPFRAELEAEAAHPGDVIAQGSLLWRVIYSVAHQLQQQHPQFQLLRHEDLSTDPEGHFERLYAQFGLAFTDKVSAGIRRATASGNPQEASLNSVYDTRLDSAANVSIWKQRLSDDEKQRIRQLTDEVARLFYSDEDWE